MNEIKAQDINELISRTYLALLTSFGFRLP
jgi:hypothetical protein